jgi:5-methylcytosine-specific restriction endonuclease McrA
VADAKVPAWKKVIHGAEKPSLPAGRTAKKCLCGAWFSLASCHAQGHKSCSAACGKKSRASARDAAKAERLRTCQHCGVEFFPRQWQIDVGVGKYCSAACRNAAILPALQAPEVMKRALVGYRKAREEGRFPDTKGEKNKRWQGGRTATLQRAKESGRQAAWCKNYRKNNPHKVREFDQRRRGRKTGRLPKGTVSALYVRQRGRCASCTCKLPTNYHTDHITPLAKGGKHEPLNIQLLCPTCNVRKSARDPLVFARMNGRLL